jgi:aspartate 1-decarboxylase
LPFERVEIYNCNNGERFATYVILGEKGQICLNGAAARKVHKGDLVIIASYAELDAATEAFGHKPQLVMVNSDNTIKKIHHDYEGEV